MWYKTYPACNDTLSTSKQSPINIVTADAKYNASLELPKFKNYNNTFSTANFDIINSGHGVKVTPMKQPANAKAQVMYKGNINSLRYRTALPDFLHSLIVSKHYSDFR